jgi:3-hydroxyacyl-CoA dehydrogenase/enoyl-CoA hydratase/3-hydroxybutyryl-CoA epimerase
MNTPTPARPPQPNAGPAAAHALAASPVPERIRRHVTEDHVCILTFDRPDSSANIFDRETLAELGRHLDCIATDPSLRGLILASAKPSIFIAGADLASFSRAQRPEDFGELIDAGHTLFNRLGALSIPTAAAIHGACVGGGYEICLACDYRIASPDKVTKIGLPEIMLGILPAWGGSTRLPRLIGVPQALDLILAGKTLAAQPALKRGLIDAIAPKECLIDKARAQLLAHGRQLRARRLPLARRVANLGPVARLIARRVERQLLRKTRGLYPAPLKALEVITRGISRSPEESFALERAAMIELGQTEAARNLIRVFFLQERARKLSPGTPAPGEAPPAPVRRVAVVGAGVMGGGIAQWVSARDVPVLLRDISPEAVARGMQGIAKLYEAGVKRHALTRVEARAGLDRVVPSATEVPLGSIDLVIEAAVERMDLKKQLFARLDELAGPRTILASNTSALSISELAAATRHPGRVVGIHFFNPVHKMQLVEIVAGRQTDPAVVRRAVRFVQQIGKLPVVVQDSPGFLVNRILMPYLMEAGHLFEHGARVEDLDESMLEFGMPMGPLRLIDEVGLDVCQHVAADLAGKFSERMSAPGVLARMTADQRLGRKSGRGFYDHPPGEGVPAVSPQVDGYRIDDACVRLDREALRRRMVLLMVNEAARCLEEGVVADPADVDFGMILGTGFAPFTGGPLRYADAAGLPGLVNEMKALAGQGELRFTPCNLLQALAGSGRNFYRG